MSETVMNIRFLVDGECPDVGKFKEGDERTVPYKVGKILTERGGLINRVACEVNNTPVVATKALVVKQLKEV